jgi:hypothetical protein
MMAPQTAKFFRQWVMLIEKYSRAGAIMQAGIKRGIISAPSLKSDAAPVHRTFASARHG